MPAILDKAPPDYFHPTVPIHASRAPGRLDVMGGISDYSGGLCLEWPLACATHCLVQKSDDGNLTIHSGNAEAEGWTTRIEIPVTAFTQPRTKAQSDARWADYVIGCFAILQQAGKLDPGRVKGARLFVWSDVPLGAGVSSSASLEVAAMSAICAAYEIQLEGAELARLCQRVENEWVGAPCGIMDQMTVALGRQGQLLRLLCQPDIVQGYEELPEGIELFGINSNVKHSVGGSAYGKARCGAFMGRRIMQDLAPGIMPGLDGTPHLANIPSDIWRALRERVPEELHGQEFLDYYADHGDPNTIVDPHQTYRVRLAMEHPIYEADRTFRFARLLKSSRENAAARDPLLEAAGELMIQSHFSYEHRCGLGSPETDLMVQLAREHGLTAGILGAKITGGGAGGTVAILADRRRNDHLEATMRYIMETYHDRTGLEAQLFVGSSDGAVATTVKL